MDSWNKLDTLIPSDVKCRRRTRERCKYFINNCNAPIWDSLTCTDRGDNCRSAPSKQRQSRGQSGTRAAFQAKCCVRRRCYAGAISPGTTPSDEFQLLWSGKTMWPLACPQPTFHQSLRMLLAPCMYSANQLCYRPVFLFIYFFFKKLDGLLHSIFTSYSDK